MNGAATTITHLNRLEGGRVHSRQSYTSLLYFVERLVLQQLSALKGVPASCSCDLVACGCRSLCYMQHFGTSLHQTGAKSASPDVLHGVSELLTSWHILAPALELVMKACPDQNHGERDRDRRFHLSPYLQPLYRVVQLIRTSCASSAIKVHTLVNASITVYIYNVAGDWPGAPGVCHMNDVQLNRLCSILSNGRATHNSLRAVLSAVGMKHRGVVSLEALGRQLLGGRKFRTQLVSFVATTRWFGARWTAVPAYPSLNSIRLCEHVVTATSIVTEVLAQSKLCLHYFEDVCGFISGVIRTVAASLTVPQVQHTQVVLAIVGLAAAASRVQLLQVGSPHTLRDLWLCLSACPVDIGSKARSGVQQISQHIGAFLASHYPGRDGLLILCQSLARAQTHFTAMITCNKNKETERRHLRQCFLLSQALRIVALQDLANCVTTDDFASALCRNPSMRCVTPYLCGMTIAAITGTVSKLIGPCSACGSGSASFFLHFNSDTKCALAVLAVASRSSIADAGSLDIEEQIVLALEVLSSSLLRLPFGMQQQHQSYFAKLTRVVLSCCACNSQAELQTFYSFMLAASKHGARARRVAEAMHLIQVHSSFECLVATS